MYIVSAKFKNVFVAHKALQENKSGPRSKNVGNHWYKCMETDQS